MDASGIYPPFHVLSSTGEAWLDSPPINKYCDTTQLSKWNMAMARHYLNVAAFGQGQGRTGPIQFLALKFLSAYFYYP